MAKQRKILNQVDLFYIEHNVGVKDPVEIAEFLNVQQDVVNEEITKVLEKKLLAGKTQKVDRARLISAGGEQVGVQLTDEIGELTPNQKRVDPPYIFRRNKE